MQQLLPGSQACQYHRETRHQSGVHVGCTDQSKQQTVAVDTNYRVCDNVPRNSKRINRSETFAALSPLTMLFAREFLSPLQEGKVSQSVSTIVFEAVVVIDITGALSAQTFLSFLQFRLVESQCIV